MDLTALTNTPDPADPYAVTCLILCGVSPLFFMAALAPLVANWRRTSDALLAVAISAFIAMVVTMLIALVVDDSASTDSSGTREHNLTQAAATYVHDHNQLTAMNLNRGGHGATFDADRTDGTTVRVHVTWDTRQPGGSTRAPAGHSQITANVTPDPPTQPRSPIS